MGSGGNWYLKSLFGVIAFVGFVGFLLAEILASGGTKTTTTTTTTTTVTTAARGNFKHLEVIGKNRPVVHPDLDPNYMSKRRVPNGPDPIHNRKAGKSRQPPGRA